MLFTFDSPIPIPSPSSEILWYILAGAMLLSVTHAIIILYHWHRYNIDSLFFGITTRLVYGAGVLLSLLIMASAAVAL